MDFSVVVKALPLVLKGLRLTIFMALSVLILGSFGGFVLAITRIWGNLAFSRVVAIYTWLLRGTPTLIILFFCYFGVPALGIDTSPLAAAVLGLTLHESAYLAEIIRAGIGSVHPGQFDAARSLGLSFPRTLWRVVLPQAARAIVPPYVTRATEIVKGTSLASVIAVQEATQFAYRIMSYNYRPFEMFTLVAVLFLIINQVVLAFQPFAERKWALKK